MPSAGIAIGDSYYWWKFRHGGKHYSKTPPKQSQLTQSEFLSALYGIQEEIEILIADDGLSGAVEDIANRLRDMAEECESKIQNMPDSLQDSDTANMLQERADACNAAADELEGIDFDGFDEDEAKEEAEDERDPEDDETIEEIVDRKRDAFYERCLEEVQAVSIDAA